MLVIYNKITIQFGAMTFHYNILHYKNSTITFANLFIIIIILMYEITKLPEVSFLGT